MITIKKITNKITKHLNILLIFIFFSNYCTTVPENKKSLMEKPVLKNKNMVSIVVTHLKDSREIAALNSGIFSIIGSEIIIPAISKTLKETLNSILNSTTNENISSVDMSGFIDVASKIVDPDYILLISTNQVKIKKQFLFIEKIKYGIELKGILWDVKNQKLLGTVKYYETISDRVEKNLIILNATGKNAMSYLLDE